MTNSKPANMAKPTSTAKKAPKAAEPNEAISPRPNASSKQADVIDMLRQPQGATIPAIMEASGWQQHSVRGFFSGVVRKKLGFTLESDKPNDGDRVYRIVADKPVKSRRRTETPSRRVD